MNCPNCNSENTIHNPVFSWENGSGEIFNCLDCGRVFEEDEYYEESE